MCFVCLLANRHTTFKRNGVIFVFPVLKGSADTLVRRSGNYMYTIFQLLTFYETFPPKIIKIQLCLLELQLKMPGILLYETQCIIHIMCMYILVQIFCTAQHCRVYS